MRLQVEKLVANQALEAVNEVLGHLQSWSMDLEMQGVDRPTFLTNDYRRARRLRDKLSAQLNARPQEPEFDLDAADTDLLVSCCIHAIEGIEATLASGEERDGEWARRNMQNLFNLALDVAQNPVERIEGPGREAGPQPRVVKMIAAIAAKAHATFKGLTPRADDADAPGGGGAHTAPGAGAGATMIRKGESQMDEWLTNWSASQRNPLPNPTRRRVEVPPPGPAGEYETGFGIPMRRTIETPGWSPAEAPAPQRSGVAFEGVRPADAERDNKIDPVGIDVRSLRDPRLRATLLLDLKALRRAITAQDHRMTAVHLSSVFEGVVADVALQRRAELGLRGTPDTWPLAPLVTTLLGGRALASDRNTILHLEACKDLVRPTAQLVNPTVVTRQTVEKMLEFLRRFLDATGLAERI